MDKTFSEWLADELEKREMKQIDLARKSGVTSAQISRIISGQRGAESKTIYSIARALKIPTEQVFRAAGLLPPEPETDVWVEETSYKISLIPPGLRSVASKFIDSLIEDQTDKQSQANTKHSTT